MKTRSRWWLAPTSDAGTTIHSASNPRRARLRRTSPNSRPELADSSPRTFSKNPHRAPVSRSSRTIQGQSHRSSSSPRPFPAWETGGHGKPPTMPSTRPRHSAPSKVLRSDQTGAGSRAPSSMRDERSWAAKASRSTQQTTRASGSATLTPRSSPPTPEQMEMIREERRST